MGNISAKVVAVFALASACMFTAGSASCRQEQSHMDRRNIVLEAARSGEEGLPVLAQALNDEHFIVRRTAAWSLAQAGEPAAEILSGALHNSDFEIRRTALVALNRTGKLSGAQLFAAKKDDNQVVRRTAAELADVLKRWNFLPDVSPDVYAPVLQLRGGTQLVDGGPSGLSIKSLPGHPIDADDEVKGHGAVVPNHPALTPEGAFTIEMWLKPDPAMARREGRFSDYPWAYMVDKKHIHNKHRNPDSENHNDYMVALRPVGENWGFGAWLGFGEETEMRFSDQVTLEPGKWHHFALTYDGSGDLKFYLDGRRVGGTVFSGRGGITHGRRPLVIGDRIGSFYGGFPGKIDSVRIHYSVVDITPAP